MPTYKTADLLTTKQLADIAGCSVNTVREWRRKWKIKEADVVDRAYYWSRNTIAILKALLCENRNVGRKCKSGSGTSDIIDTFLGFDVFETNLGMFGARFYDAETGAAWPDNQCPLFESLGSLKEYAQNVRHDFWDVIGQYVR